MSDRLVPDLTLMYADLLFVRSNEKNAKWHKKLRGVKTRYPAPGAQSAFGKNLTCEYELDPNWMRTVSRSFPYVRAVGLILIFLLTILNKADELSVVYLCVLGFLMLFLAALNGEDVRLIVAELRKYMIIGLLRGSTFFKRIFFGIKSFFLVTFFSKNENVQERIFRESPREFRLLSFSPASAAYHNLITLDSPRVFVNAYEDGVHKDLSARGMLHLAQADTTVLEKLAADGESEYAEHASAWLERLRTS